MNRLHVTDPGHAALRRAVRAAIIAPMAFAIGDVVVDDPNTAIFCVFGAFGLLAMVDFGGARRRRLFWFCILGLVGVATISLGTLCSRQLVLATATMAVAGFAILFAGVANGYLAAMSVVALLLYVLPVTVQAPPDAIPWRLAGWGIAFAMAVPAALLLWPYYPRDKVRLRAWATCEALADLLDSLAPAGDPAGDPAEMVTGSEAASRFQAARTAYVALQHQWVSTPYRGSGPTRVESALARLVDELNWLLGLTAPPVGSPAGTPPVLFCKLDVPEDVAVLRISARTLRGCAGWMRREGREGDARDLEDLQAAAERSAAALRERLAALRFDDDSGGRRKLVAAWLTGLSPSFRVRGIAYSTAAVAATVTSAARSLARAGEASRVGVETSTWSDSLRQALDLAPLTRTTRLLREHLTPGSVWFRNSLRGAVALAAAVGIEAALSLQHGFWVVLATLSVLRSSAAGTGTTASRAVVGTVVGFAVGGALMVGVGSAPELLWALLPPVVFLAGFAGTISFAAGQAAFTIVVVVLFNIIEPEGWKVGLVRLEDVLIGCAVSVGVGFLFWPHGAGAALAERLAAAYRSGTTYLVTVVRGAVAYGDRSAEKVAEAAEEAARAAGRRLDDAFGQYLAERGARRYEAKDLAALIVGASRTRLIAESLATTSERASMPAPIAAGGRDDGERGRGNSGDGNSGDGNSGDGNSGDGNSGDRVPSEYRALLDHDLTAVQTWFGALADALSAGGPVPPPQGLDPEAHCRALVPVQQAVAADRQAVTPTLTLLLVGQHLDYLARLETYIAPAAERVACVRTTPWWR